MTTNDETLKEMLSDFHYAMRVMAAQGAVVQAQYATISKRKLFNLINEMSEMALQGVKEYQRKIEGVDMDKEMLDAIKAEEKPETLGEGA